MTQTYAVTQIQKTKKPIRTIIAAGLLAGTLDAIGAIVSYTIKGGKTPVIIFKYIASGVFGKETAYAAGNIMPVLGVIFHYLIAFLFTIFLFLVYPFVKSLLRNWALIGFLYGIFVWLIMNKIVLPLSNAPKLQTNTTNVIVGIFILVLCIGLPVALVVDRYYSKERVN